VSPVPVQRATTDPPAEVSTRVADAGDEDDGDGDGVPPWPVDGEVGADEARGLPECREDGAVGDVLGCEVGVLVDRGDGLGSPVEPPGCEAEGCERAAAFCATESWARTSCWLRLLTTVPLPTASRTRTTVPTPTAVATLATTAQPRR
jgi:hypothetical protein